MQEAAGTRGMQLLTSEAGQPQQNSCAAAVTGVLPGTMGLPGLQRGTRNELSPLSPQHSCPH